MKWLGCNHTKYVGKIELVIAEGYPEDLTISDSTPKRKIKAIKICFMCNGKIIEIITDAIIYDKSVKRGDLAKKITNCIHNFGFKHKGWTVDIVRGGNKKWINHVCNHPDFDGFTPVPFCNLHAIVKSGNKFRSLCLDILTKLGLWNSIYDWKCLNICT